MLLGVTYRQKNYWQNEHLDHQRRIGINSSNKVHHITVRKKYIDVCTHRYMGINTKREQMLGHKRGLKAKMFEHFFESEGGGGGGGE